MMRILTAILCIMTLLFASTAYAYKSDVKQLSAVQAEDEETQGKAPEGKEEQKQKEGEGDYPEGGTSGMMIGGYVLIAVGGLAAIAGSTILTATDKDILGVSLSAGGGALGLAGSLMLIFGSRTYDIGPAVDLKNGTYGVRFAKRF
jgi:hypothetical protein